MDEPAHLNAVAYERDGVWIVQGIDFDIRARARSDRMQDLKKAIETAYRERVALDKHLGRKPLEGIGPAPEQYRKMFQWAKDQETTNSDGKVEVRVYAH